jgi:FkbM family methyltransferase
MKRRLQALLQRALGLQAYLFCFSLCAMAKMRWAEPAFFQFLKLIPDKGLFLDLGANLGVTTTLLARRCPHARILAFEPVPWNVANIRRLVRLLRFRNVTIHDFAAGDQNGSVDFVVPVVCGARMHGLGHFSANGEPGERFKVPCRKLDDLGLSDVTAIKLDVENSEYSVLCGGLQLLKKWRPVIYCELWHNENGEKSMALLGELGYKPYTVESGQLVALSRSMDRTLNLILFPEPESAFVPN